jgi:ribonucleotide reductase alpha subunit
MVYAWETGCKGITIYRDGSRNVQVLENVTKEDALLQECPTGVCDI